MSHLFADIYDGIRCLRILRGVSEKDILNYVQARVGNMKVGNVLKTIRTLRKLVDEGILVKKGKRYAFSGKSPKRECYESEEDNQGDECDEDDECDMEDDDAKDEQDDDEDEDDDDGCGDEEDNEEDDFDDDDDDNCDNNDQEDGDNAGKDEKKMEEANAKESKKIDSKSSFIMKPKVEENRESETMRSNSNATEKTREDIETPVSEPKYERRRESKRRRRYLEQAAETEKRASQENAFCARDFIDSLQSSKEEDTKKDLDLQGKSQSDTESCESKFPFSEPKHERRRESKRRRRYLEQAAETEKRASQENAFCARDFIDSLQSSKEEDTKKDLDLQGKSQSDTESRERLEKYPPRNRGSRMKWDREPHCSYRSRSPVKGRNRDCYDDSLNTGRSNGFGYRSSNALFIEAVDNEGEIEEKKMEPEAEDPPPQTNAQGGSQPEESSKPPSREEKYVLEVIESEVSPKESVDSCVPQNRAAFGGGSRRNWLEMEDRRQERTKRGLSSDDVRSYDDKAESLCSVCDKKRRNS